VPRHKALPRIVLDTNVFVSGLISGAGPPARLLQAIRDRQVVHVVSDPIVEEYLRVLDYPRIRKFKMITDEFVAAVAAYLLYQTDRVELVSDIRRSRDPDDDVFLQTAVDGRTAMLVTGDKADLLSLESIEGIPILSASEAAGRLGLGTRPK
jgi:uncharacterized protein